MKKNIIALSILNKKGRTKFVCKFCLIALLLSNFCYAKSAQDELIDAVINNKNKTILSIIGRYNLNLSIIKVKKEPVVVYAIKNKFFKVAKTLIKAGGCDKSYSRRKRSIMYAIEADNADIVEALINAKVPLNARDENGKFVIAYAAKLGNVEIVKMLINARINVNRASWPSKHPIMYAIESGKAEIVKMLIDAGANIEAENEQYVRPIMYAAKLKNEEMVRIILDADAQVNVYDCDNKTAIRYAIESDNAKIVEMLINAGVYLLNHDLAGKNPIMYATEFGNEDIVEIMIKEVMKNDPYINPLPNMRCAIRSKNTKIVEMYIEAKVKFRRRVVYAMQFGTNEIATLLINKGAWVNGHDKDGKYSIMYAAQSNNAELVKLFIEKGALINVKDNNGKTVLDYAANEKIKNLLIEAGA